MKIKDGTDHAFRFRTRIAGIIADYEVNVRSIKGAIAMRSEPNLQPVGRRSRDSGSFHDNRKGVPKPCLER